MKNNFIIYPILFAIYPILFLYSYNINLLSIDKTFIPAIISIFCTVLLWFILNLIIKDTHKAGFGTVILLLIFFSYGQLYDLLENNNIFLPMHIHLIPGILLAWGYAIYFLKLSNKEFKPLTSTLNSIATILIVLNIFNIAHYQIKNSQISLDNKNPEIVEINTKPIKSLPDIYYIILDEYASIDTAKRVYSYENHYLTNKLKEKGFYITTKSRAQGDWTLPIMAARLNLAPVDNKAPNKILSDKVCNSEMGKLIKSLGYKYIVVGHPAFNIILGDKFKFNADKYYNMYDSESTVVSVDEFTSILMNSTMIKPVYNRLTKEKYSDYYRRGIINTIQFLKKIPHTETSPKFVYAHILCPHSPFVVGPNEEIIDTKYRTNWKDKSYYLGQYEYISKEIAIIVETILKKSQKSPIIIVQSDHGPRGDKTVKFDDDAIKTIYNAIYVPDRSEKLFYDSISAINTFKVIFNRYLDTNFELSKEGY